MSICGFSVKQPVLVNLFFVILLVAGVYAYFSLPTELDPEVSLESAVIITKYPGAAPEEVEKLVTIPIEDEIKDVDGINRVISTSAENVSTIFVEFRTDLKDFKEAVRELESEVDKVKDLPEGIKDDPEVIELNTSDFPIVNAIISSDQLSEKELKKVAEDLEDVIEAIKGVDEVELAGIRDREIWVEVDSRKLYGYNLGLRHVVDSIAKRNLNVPGGDIDVGRSEYLVRAVGEVEKPEQIREIIVKADPGGKHIKVRDLALVRDTFEEPETISRLGQKPAISLLILKERGGESIRIVRDIKRVVGEYLNTLPTRVDVAYVNDTTFHINEIMNRLKSNALIGVTLVFIILFLFLGGRSAILVGIGIPFTFLTTFVFMDWVGLTFNQVTLFSLVLVLGIVVDDAIVIVENIYRYMERGLSPIKAAIKGGEEVTLPVIATVLTTIAAFLPMLLMTGIVGKYLSFIPMMVAFALAASLIEALIVLPCHMADFGKVTRRPPPGDKFIRLMEKFYKRIIFKVLKHRFLVVAVVPVVAASGLLLIPFLGIELFRFDEVSQFSVRVHTPARYSLENTDKIIGKIEELAMNLPRSEVTAVLSRTGIIIGDFGVERGSNVGEVMIDLVEAKERSRTTQEIMDDLRKKVARISGIKSVEIAEVAQGPPMGKPVAVRVRGEPDEKIGEAVHEIEAQLRRIEGVKDIKNDLEMGKNEIRVKLKDDQAALWGLTHSELAWNLRSAFDGAVASVYREGGEEIDIVVKFKESDRDTLSDLDRLRVATMDGSLVYFKNLADYHIERGFANLYRRDNESTTSVTADIDKEVTSSSKVNKILEKKLGKWSVKYPAYRFTLGGEYTKTSESFASLTRAFFVAILVIYMILGAQFKSFIQPLIIMFTVPFSFIGVIIGLLVNGDPFSLVAFIAVVGLTGIVVNDSLILVDFINTRRDTGTSKWRAIVKSGVIRMRPIMLTTITTIFGLLPMALGVGGKSNVWGPMANSIIWGLAFASLLTLFFIPALYSILGDVKWERRLRQRD